MMHFRVLVAMGAFLAACAQAHAALKLCNQTSYILYAARGSATKTDLSTSGWTRIVPGDCATPIPDPLDAPAYFIYARTSRAHSGPARAWGGGAQICARDTNFAERVKLPVRRCKTNGFYRMPFAVVDRHAKPDWTTTFTESPAIRSRADAKRAGVNRLLQDLGYHVQGPGERARDLALDDFHKRAKLPADANDAELFAALETGAINATAPAGYTICNQTEQPLWAAIGLPAPKSTTTRGWWQVAPRACSQALAQPLQMDRVYLFAKRANGAPLVSGPAKLCVASGQFHRAGNPPCSGKSVVERPFAVTNTKDRSGFVARIGESGLQPSSGTGK